jgi:uncharacterized protein (TIGR00299 family) protein
MRIAWFDCFSGVSGDMCLGALLSAGWPAAELEALPARLGLEGARVSVGVARRGAIQATRVEVAAPGSQPHRHLRHIEAILEAADLPARVRERSRAVFRRLAEAEAAVHGTTPEQVHFHEVGAVDAIVDVVGTVLGLDALGVERVSASALPVGGGSVDCEHGRMPVPAPATAWLLRGVPIVPTPIRTELVTPTGAALLATLAEGWGPPPPCTLEAVGTGAGGRDLPEQANVLRVFLGRAGEALPGRRTVTVLETALDDESPQVVAALLSGLLADGALDAMAVPATMKKGRPGVWLVVLCEPAQADRVARRLLEETSTLGVRVRHDERIELPRRAAEVMTPFGAVALKVATLPGGGERAVPEFESVRAAAERSGRPVREVAQAALAAWRARSEGA